jgi:hypothetical protein
MKTTTNSQDEGNLSLALKDTKIAEVKGEVESLTEKIEDEESKSEKYFLSNIR